MPKSERTESMEQLANLKKSMSQMQDEMPELIGKFQDFMGVCIADGALSCKEKEYIVLGAAVACHCPPCILLHVQKLLELGATREEILEAAGVGVVMGGGPGFTNMQYVFMALEDAGA